MQEEGKVKKKQIKKRMKEEGKVRRKKIVKEKNEGRG